MSPLLTRVSNSQGISGLSGFRRVFIGRRGIGGYAITRSLRFNSADQAYLNFTPEAAGNRKTWTWSAWVKISQESSTAYQNIFCAGTPGDIDRTFIRWYQPDGTIQIQDDSNGAATTSSVFRDPSAWYHFVLCYDTPQSTASDRLKFYVNGVEQTFSTVSYPAQNSSTRVNDTKAHYLGQETYTNGREFDGYLADVILVDGQALDPTNFGEFDSTGIWNPKEYTFGTNPNDGTTWSSSVTQQSDGGYYSGYEASKAFDGNLSTLPNTNASNNNGNITFTPSTPITFTDTVRAYYSPAIANSWSFNGGSSQSLSGSDGWVTIATGGGTFTSLNTYRAGDGAFFSAIEIDGYVLLDGAKNNSFHLDFSDNSSTINLGTDTSVTVSDAVANKGMDVVTYTGNGGTQTINGLRFAPDLVWIKNRNGANNNVLQDSVRGFGSSKNLSSNQTQTEGADIDGVITGNTSDGFTVSVNGQVGRGTNATNYTYVAWCWKAGGPAVTNTNGSITSQVSANQDYGFSVVTYSGSGVNADSIGHGLPSAPSFFIIKARNKVDGWRVYHSATGTGNILELNSSNAASSASNWQGVSSTTISLQNDSAINGSGYNYVGYLWSEVSGFSKFGSYTGNGSFSGPTVTLGFKPRYVLLKNASAGSTDWKVYDSARDPVYQSGINQGVLYPNLGNAEDQNYGIKWTDTGFEVVDDGSSINGNGNTIIYAAFASEPGNNWALNNFVANQTSTGFKAVTYTGNQSTQTISGVGFSPSLVWLKNRDAVKHHALLDVVRGGDKVLQSQSTGAEATASNFITSFNTDGFTIGNDSAINGSGNGIVAWCWDAGNSTVSNTDGTITSSVRANTDLGFSIVTYTGNATSGATVGHGLGATPALIICKNRDAAQDWPVYAQALGDPNNQGGPEAYALRLNGTNMWDFNAKWWNSTSPTSSVFSLGNGAESNGNTNDMVAYCFAPKPGVSAFGSYTGQTGTKTITVGFRPAFLMVKRTNSTGSWIMIDTARSPSNPVSTYLFAEDSASEGSFTVGNVTDSGFDFTTNNSPWNGNNDSYIYMAFASASDGAEVDSLLDSPTEANVNSDTGAGGEVSGGYATLNPLNKNSNVTQSNGNLYASAPTTGSAYNTGGSTISMSSGKWYCEFLVGRSGGGTNNGLWAAGIYEADVHPGSISYLPNTAGTIGVNGNDGTLYSAGSTLVSGYISGTAGSVLSDGDLVMMAYDADNGKLWIGKNGTWGNNGGTGDPAAGTNAGATGLTGTYGFLCSLGSDTGTSSVHANFGQRPFAFAAPTGYQPLTTALLDDPTIADGSTAMDVVLYSGTGATQSISGLNFSPDLVWTKNKGASASHAVYDIVRGAGNLIRTNETTAEVNVPSRFTSFDSNGYTIGGTSTENNASSNSYVAWTWDGGSSTVSNTDGSITSSVRANASAGFSICTITTPSSPGAYTFGHGLNVAPQFVIYRGYDQAMSWYTWHNSLGAANKYLLLNSTNAVNSGTYVFNNTYPSSSVITDYASNALHHNEGMAMIYYCFAPVEGYSAFGSYTGNGSTDGTFVYTGHRTRWLMVKRVDAASSWWMWDTERDTYNLSDAVLRADNAAAENTYSGLTDVDILSNGFKWRGNGADVNASGGSYIFASFAEHPFKTARAR